MGTIDRERFEKTGSKQQEAAARIDALAAIIEGGFLPKAEERAV